MSKINPNSRKIKEQNDDDDAYTLILSQAAHMDWDWLNWNSQLETGTSPVDTDQFDAAGKGNGPSQQIYNWVKNVLEYNEDDPSYYSACEIAFLKNFAENFPDEYQAILDTGRLTITGGGITSPDNLLSHGEAFIRNYAIGKQWCDEQGLTWNSCFWLPDDFGHDSQLPIVLNAMNAVAVGIARVPGNCKSTLPGNSDLAHYQLLNADSGGLTFYWECNDGSKILTHYMPDQYHQGGNITGASGEGTCDFGNTEDCQKCNDKSSNADSGIGHLANYINCNKSVSPCNVIYVNVSDDFTLPKGVDYNHVTEYSKSVIDTDTLPFVCAEWNAQSDNAALNVTAQAGTFVDYINAINDSGQASGLKTRKFYGDSENGTMFQPTPYWMGFYATRPALKYLHYATTKALLAAEVFERIAHSLSISSSSNEFRSLIQNAWNNLVPSTHHDYITGTASIEVYDSVVKDSEGNEVEGEQLALSKKAFMEACAAREIIYAAIVDQVNVENTLVVFNPLGISRSGELVLLKAVAGEENLPSGGTTQVIDEGTLLLASAPSMGCGFQSEPETADGSVSYSSDDSYLYLTNDQMEVSISKTDGSISSLKDLNSNKEVFSGSSGAIDIYGDTGDCYKFGYESGNDFSSILDTCTVSTINAKETGPLRITVEIDLEYTLTTSGSDTYPFTLTYQLVYGEKILRMALEGTAPDFTTVVTSFALEDTLAYLDHGTPCHWDSKEVTDYPGNSSFNSIMEATHDLIIAKDSSKNPLGAIFHSGIDPDFSDADMTNVPGATPAWGSTTDKKGLFGCLLRSVKSTFNDDQSIANDQGSHKVFYAFRIPSGIGEMEDGVIHQEAKKYNTPMDVYCTSDDASGPLVGDFSLAAVSDDSSGAMILAGKQAQTNGSGSDLVLRVHCPKNTSTKVKVNAIDYITDCLLTKAYKISALEDPTTAGDDLTIDNGVISYTQENAVETIYLE